MKVIVHNSYDFTLEQATKILYHEEKIDEATIEYNLAGNFAVIEPVGKVNSEGKYGDDTEYVLLGEIDD